MIFIILKKKFAYRKGEYREKDIFQNSCDVVVLFGFVYFY